MATYFVGDIQGCFQALQQLLAKIDFQPTSDTLWCVGDLVGRGPEPAQVLRYLSGLGNHAVCVLGNHDLHALAAFAGITHAKPEDQLDALFNAPDAPALMHWLRTQPFLVQHPTQALIMVHAGLSPQWQITEAIDWAEQLQQQFTQEASYHRLLKAMYTQSLPLWQDIDHDFERCIYALNTFTRIRFCHPNGQLDFHCKVPPEQTTLLPWYHMRANTEKSEPQIIFGHWSALAGQLNSAHYQALDTGCVWGGCLTAWCLESNMRFHVNCNAHFKTQ